MFFASVQCVTGKLYNPSIRQNVLSYKCLMHYIKFVWLVYTRRDVCWHQSINTISRGNIRYGFYVFIYRVSCRWHKSKLSYSKELKHRNFREDNIGGVQFVSRKKAKCMYATMTVLSVCVCDCYLTTLAGTRLYGVEWQDDWWIRKYMEGSGRGLIEVLPWKSSVRTAGVTVEIRMRTSRIRT